MYSSKLSEVIISFATDYFVQGDICFSAEKTIFKSNNIFQNIYFTIVQSFLAFN